MVSAYAATHSEKYKKERKTGKMVKDREQNEIEHREKDADIANFKIKKKGKDSVSTRTRTGEDDEK
jgi:hypothetical protein